MKSRWSLLIVAALLLAAVLAVAPVGAQGTACSVTGSNVNIRSGPGTPYAIISSLRAGMSVPVQGQNANGSWYVVGISRQRQGWVAASVVRTSGDCGGLAVVAVTGATTRSGQQTTTNPQPAQPTQQPAASTWSCGGNLYNCGDFGSCGQVMSYWNACPGDPSDLDGNDDGRPCEKLCGG